MPLIGLDVGTTGCKAIILDRTGRILGQGAREYAIAFPHPDWAEQDAEQVWQLAWSALSEAVREAGGTIRLAQRWAGHGLDRDGGGGEGGHGDAGPRRGAARGQALGLPARGTGALPVS